MRYLSLFDGIGAAHVAWRELGWQCVGVSEVEDFTIAVTKHHYPDVPHLGDITQITDDQIAALGPIDLIVGGFPCQDLSVAGRRAGLRNEDGTVTRSGLFYDAMRIVRVARERCGLRWLLIENVPGLYSSNGGRDFAAVVGAMVGSEFNVPRDGWRNAGFATGPLGLCEWGSLDAQYFNLAQRRLRLYALADFGDWQSRPPILVERESLRGDSAPRREPREVAPTIPARSSAGGGLGTDFDCDGGLIAHPSYDTTATVDASFGRLQGASNQDANHGHSHLVPFQAYGGNNQSGPIEVATARNAHGGPHGRLDFESETFVVQALAIRGRDEGRRLELRGDGLANAIIPPHGGHDGIGTGAVLAPLPFDETQVTHPENRCNPQPGDPCHPLAATARPPSIAFTSDGLTADPVSASEGKTYTHEGEHNFRLHNVVGQTAPATPTMMVRRLTPKETEILQGFPEGYTDITHRNKPAADGPRYRAIGNSFAVNVMRWIGKRIAEAVAKSS